MSVVGRSELVAQTLWAAAVSLAAPALPAGQIPVPNWNELAVVAFGGAQMAIPPVDRPSDLST